MFPWKVLVTVRNRLELHLTQLSLLKQTHTNGGGGGSSDATKDRLQQSLECVRITFLHQEQSSDYQWAVFQGKSQDKSVLISSLVQPELGGEKQCANEVWGASSYQTILPSSALAGRHWVLKTWANRARNRSTLCLISILLTELQLLAFLQLELHSDLWGISSGSFTALD